MSVGPILTLGLGAFTGGGVQYLPTLGYGTNATPPPPPADTDVIRNFSLRNWRKWKRDDLEEGRLPEELRQEADQAVAEAVNAAAELVAKRVEPENAIAVQMQARETYEEVFKQAYREEYVASIVAENWKADMRKMRRRRIKMLLLMN